MYHDIIESQSKRIRQAEKDGFTFGLCTGIILTLFVLIAFSIGTAEADDSPPKTTLAVCDGSLPSLSLRGGHCEIVDVTATDPLHAQHIAYEPQAFIHTYFQSGDPACIATGRKEGHHTVLHSGRDCNRDHAQCAYISQGYNVYAVTGQSCTEAGIDKCGGPFCR